MTVPERANAILTLSEVANIAGQDLPTIRSWVAEGRFTVVRMQGEDYLLTSEVARTFGVRVVVMPELIGVVGEPRTQLGPPPATPAAVVEIP